MSDGAAARLLELVAAVATPLAVGGALRPVRPIGDSLAAAMAELAPGLDDAAFRELGAARGDVWRTLLATDDAPPLTPACVRLLAATSDLLQCTNPALGGLMASSRCARLAASVERSVAAVARPATIGDALSRHATLAGLARLVRHDTKVSWWSGHALFVGRAPPARLRAWPTVRRVREERTETPLFALADRGPVPEARYHALLAALLARSPLTELSLADHAVPAFAISPSLRALSATPLGRTIVRRLLDGASAEVHRAWEKCVR